MAVLLKSHLMRRLNPNSRPQPDQNNWSETNPKQPQPQQQQPIARQSLLRVPGKPPKTSSPRLTQIASRTSICSPSTQSESHLAFPSALRQQWQLRISLRTNQMWIMNGNQVQQLRRFMRSLSRLLCSRRIAAIVQQEELAAISIATITDLPMELENIVH